jgi:hypothetical protein
METGNSPTTAREPWNKGKLVGQKTPFKLKEIWAIRIRLQMASRRRELALFNLAIDSKLRACDLIQLRVRAVRHGQIMASRALVLQQKTHRPVQFEITSQPEWRYRRGLLLHICNSTISCFRAGSAHRRIYPHGNTPGSSILGLSSSA